MATSKTIFEDEKFSYAKNINIKLLIIQIILLI